MVSMVIKENDRVHIKVKNEYKMLFFPSFLHELTGNVWQIDNEHIWIKSVMVDPKIGHYVSGPHRYNLEYVDIDFAK